MFLEIYDVSFNIFWGFLFFYLTLLALYKGKKQEK